MSESDLSNLPTSPNLQELVIKVDNQVYSKLAKLADRSGYSQSDLVNQALHLLFTKFTQSAPEAVGSQPADLTALPSQSQTDSSPGLPQDSDRLLANHNLDLDRQAQVNALLSQHSQQISQLQAQINQLQQRLSGLEHNSSPNPAIDSPLLNPVIGAVKDSSNHSNHNDRQESDYGITPPQPDLANSVDQQSEQPTNTEQVSDLSNTNSGDRRSEINQATDSDTPLMPSVRQLVVGDLVQVRDQQSPYYMQILMITKVGLIRASVSGDVGEISMLKRDLRYVRSPHTNGSD
jgi:hypothetical protein